MAPGGDANRGLLLAHALLIPPLAALFWLDRPEVSLAAAVAARVAYNGYGGWALASQDRTGRFTRRWGAEEGYRRFRSRVLVLMNLDGALLVLACWAGRGTLETEVPGIAISLVVLGANLLGDGHRDLLDPHLRA